MSSPPQAPVSFSQFGSILDSALSEYTQKTGNDLLGHWLTKKLQGCDSVEAVLDLIQHQAEPFDSWKLMKWIRSSVYVLYMISATLGMGVDMALPVCAGIGALFAVTKHVRASRDALVDLFERVQFFLKRIEVHTPISPTEDMVEILVKIMAEVIGILSIATKEMQRSRIGIYLHRLMSRTDIEDALKRLDSLTQEEVRMAMAMAQVLRGINELKGDAKKADEAPREIKWNQIEQDVRRWFSPPDPSVNYNIARTAYQEGTAAWFFQGGIFKEWELVGSLLWVHGKPGSGKSILSSVIIKHVRSLRDAGDATLAYFFFDFRDEMKRQPRDFLTSLLIQLSAHSNLCCKIISDFYSDHGHGTQQPSIDALAKCLRDMLFVATQRPVYFIIDALDECPDKYGLPTPRMVLLDLLKGLVDLCIPNLHICVTSRPEVDIKIVLEPLSHCAVSLHEESGEKDDIFDYVNTVVNSDRQMRKWRDADRKFVVEELTEKADGMFRWVFCQLEVLRHCLPASIRQTLDQLPESLDETYERILSEIPRANQGAAHRLLQCLTVAVRPLRVEELAELLAFEFDIAQGTVPRYRAGWRTDDQELAVLSTCSSLIAIVNDNGSQVVQFSHFSVKQFLTSDRLVPSFGNFSQYYIRLGPAHTVLTQACLGYLLRLDDHVDDESVNRLPLAEYAARHWVTHAQFEGVASRVRDGIENLFDPDKPHFAAWIGTYNIDEPSRTYRESFSEMPTHLYYASLCGFSDLIEHFAVKHPQHVNAIGGRYELPLLAALSRKHFLVAEILRKYGADIDIRGTRQRTPLHNKIDDSDDDVVRLLLEQGADANARQDDLSTPLHLSARNGNSTGALMLLEHGAEVNARNLEGKTPLCLLAEHNDLDENDLAPLLLKHGAEVNARTKNQWTPLHWSTLRGRLKIARALLDNGANPNAENDQGETPLHLVSRGNYDSLEHGVGIAKLLLERGADAHARNKVHATPWLLARYRGRFDIARVLLYHDAKAPIEDK